MSLYESGASLGPHYEDKLRVVLTNVWRHKLMIIVTVAAALVIGIALAIMMPKRVYGGGLLARRLRN